MNMMPTEEPVWHQKPPPVKGEDEDDEDEDEEQETPPPPEIVWGRTYAGKLDGGVDVNWTVDPPSTTDAESYALPSTAPKMIKLSKKYEYVQGERNPLQFLNLILTEQLLNR